MMEAGVGMITEAALPVKTGGAAFCVFTGGFCGARLKLKNLS